MLVLSPEVVRFGERVWEDGASVTVDEVGERVVVEFSDEGSHAPFVDVPERRVTVRVVRVLASGEDDPVRVGEREALVFYAASNASDAGRVRVTMTAVVVRVRHEVIGRGGGASGAMGGRQVIDLVAEAPDGGTDPIVRTPVETVDLG